MLPGPYSQDCFRPLVGEGSTLLQWIAALENTGLLLLTVGALVARALEPSFAK